MEEIHSMLIGNLFVVGIPRDYKIHLSLNSTVADGNICVALSNDELERLITYLKGVRDGVGWNKKTQGDRNL